MPDHAHGMSSIPPNYAVSKVIGYIKGKSAITRVDPGATHACITLYIFENFPVGQAK